MIDFLSRLVQANSDFETGEVQAAEIVRDQFTRSGVDCQLDTWHGNRANVVARVKGTGDKQGILFASHLDVVPPGNEKWDFDPFSGTIKDGRVYGRGATDMKGGLAASAKAICDLVASGVKLKGDVVFLAAAGEETDSSGAERFLEKAGNERFGGVVIPEPTDSEVVTAHRGILWLNITTYGRTAHGSKPHLGINAINSMRQVLDELSGYCVLVTPHELLGGCSVSINTISAGKAINVVPDQCRIGVDIRTLPEQDVEKIIADIHGIFKKCRQRDKNFRAEVETIRRVGAMETDWKSNFVHQFCEAVKADKTRAVGYTTDGPHFAKLGPVVVFGPGKSEMCHQPNEFIEIADVEKAAENYRNVILKLLS